MIKKLLFALLLGSGVAMLFIERDPWACMRVGEMFKNFFSTTYACSMQADVEQVSLFSPSLKLRNVVVTAPDGLAWQWSASRFTIGFSWWQFLMYGVANLYVHLDEVSANVSSLDGIYALQEHLNLMSTAGVSTILSRMDEILVNSAELKFDDSEKLCTSTVRVRYAMRRIDGVVRSFLTVLDGSLVAQGVSVVEKISGSVQIDIPYDTQVTRYDVQGECTCVVPRLPAEQRMCFVRGSWRDGRGKCTLFNTDRTVVVDPITIVSTDNGYVVNSKIQSTGANLAALIGLGHTELIGGETVGLVRANVHDGTCDVQAELMGTNCTYAGQLVASSCALAGKKEGDISSGTVSIVRDGIGQCIGTWQYSWPTGVGALQMSNSTPYAFPMTSLWACAPGACTVSAARDTTGVITGTYQGEAEHVYKKNKVTGAGTFIIEDAQAKIDGMCGSTHYRADFFADPAWQLRFVQCTNDAGEPLVTLRSLPRKPTHIKAIIDVAFIRTLLASLYEYDVQGAGQITVDAHYGPTTIADIRLTQGTIRMAHVYNVINSMRAHLAYDQAMRTLTATDVVCSLHKGSVQIKRAVVQHSEQGVLSHWHAPLTLKNCLINFKNNFFASISGHLTASYTAGSLPHVAGTLLLDRSQIKENIFSDQFQQRIASLAEVALISTGPDVTCDLFVETVTPLRVQTPFLEADAQMAFKIGNTARDPHVSGQLTILSGSLLFPYRSLHITKGVITMVPEQPRDPLIELVAQNQVRNHAISMHVTGSLLQHHLMFESTPPLTEEQIVALLLVGSEEESLNIVMPTLIMQNLASLVFGSDTSASALDRYFKRLIRPFKGIHIVPRFSDQSSRGGLRGAIDIEVNDRWHALIQKNFNLTEDTRFELEYQASDDVSVRAIRDEHRDMGAEIEMRWKF